MNKLMLVDGSNIVMRAAFGGELAPERAVPIATGLIERAVRQVQASHLIVALDSPGTSWRRVEYPDYKAHRTLNTEAWLSAAHAAWTRLDWWVEAQNELEADDIIATLATRAHQHAAVVVVSGDSDLYPLIELPVEILRPENGGKFTALTATIVCGRYRITAPRLLTSLKALTGEKGDNIPGVPGIGPARAAQLLATYGGLEQIISAGLDGKCKHSSTVAKYEAVVRQAYTLVSLKTDAPIPPVKPHLCAWRN